MDPPRSTTIRSGAVSRYEAEITKGAPASRLSNDPAVLMGWGIAVHSRPDRPSTRAISATARGMSSMSCRHVYATARSKASSRNGSASASARRLALRRRDRPQTAPSSARHRFPRRCGPVPATACLFCPPHTRRPACGGLAPEACPAGQAHLFRRANGHGQECERTSPSSVPRTPSPAASSRPEACHSRPAVARPGYRAARPLISANQQPDPYSHAADRSAATCGVRPAWPWLASRSSVIERTALDTPLCEAARTRGGMLHMTWVIAHLRVLSRAWGWIAAGF
jgi:hypothetical protein